jgi:small GTP-binding protein
MKSVQTDKIPKINKNTLINKLKIPMVALIGLPNSGKSSLTNRFSENRVAITANEAHTTRDLNYGECEWGGKYFRIVDTGGLVPDPEGKIQKAVQIKSWGAIAEADMLVWVIDCKQNLETISDEIIQKVWKTGKPFIVVLNKVDDPNLDRSQADYAKLGGLGFINISCNIGYNLGELADMIVKVLEEKGYSTNLNQKPELANTDKYKHKEDRRLKSVERKLDGTYIIRGADGIFESINERREMDAEESIDNIIFDFYGVVFTEALNQNFDDIQKEFELSYTERKELMRLYLDIYEYGIVEPKAGEKEILQVFGKKVSDSLKSKKILTIPVEQIESTCTFLKFQKSIGRSIYYISNIGNSYKDRQQDEIYKYFDGGIASCNIDYKKPDKLIYKSLLKKYDLNARNCLFIDDKVENTEMAKKIGMKIINYKTGETDLNRELRILEGKNPNPPKVLFLGKPNVGKSSLFNAMVGQEIQIVTDVAGTTLSVNQMAIERKKKSRIYVNVKIPQESI